MMNRILLTILFCLWSAVAFSECEPFESESKEVAKHLCDLFNKEASVAEHVQGVGVKGDFAFIYITKSLYLQLSSDRLTAKMIFHNLLGIMKSKTKSRVAYLYFYVGPKVKVIEASTAVFGDNIKIKWLI